MTLSERLQSIANASAAAKAALNVPGVPTEFEGIYDYMEETKGFLGVSFYCHLCNMRLEKLELEIHMKDKKHCNLSKNMKEKEKEKEKYTTEDELVLAKHEMLSPTEEEFHGVKDIVLSCEKGLKLVSDFLAKGDGSSTVRMETYEASNIAKEGATDESKTIKTNEGTESSDVALMPRMIKGVMRAGLLGNGLLMKGEIDVHLVLLSTDKPTVDLLSQIADNLPQQLATITEDKYDLVMNTDDACIIVTAQKEPKATCKISLTSPTMRLHPFKYYNEIASPDPLDVLPQQRCEESLRELRRARWFEAKAYALPFCEIVMRVFRDLCNRVPTWKKLDLWLLELLVQKCLSTADANTTAGVAVQRVFECVAGGILLPDSPGLYDPCEREPTDLSFQLTQQEREEITSSAQYALRLIAFQQMQKILDISLDEISSEKMGNKRKRTDGAEFTLQGKVDGKKNKPEIVSS